MPCMTSHHFDDLHPAMRSSRSAGSLNHFRYITQRRIKAQGVISSCQVLVDRLWDANNTHSLLRELCRYAERVLAAADHDSVKPKFFNVLNYFSGPIVRLSGFRHLFEGISAR